MAIAGPSAENTACLGHPASHICRRRYLEAVVQATAGSCKMDSNSLPTATAAAAAHRHGPPAAARRRRCRCHRRCRPPVVHEAIAIPSLPPLPMRPPLRRRRRRRRSGAVGRGGREGRGKRGRSTEAASVTALQRNDRE